MFGFGKVRQETRTALPYRNALGITAARIPAIQARGQLPAGLIGLRTQVGQGGGPFAPRVPVLTPGWQWMYQRQERILHAPTVPPPIVYSAMHPTFIGPQSGVQGFVNTGPSSYFTGDAGQSWPRRLRPYLLPAAFNKWSWQLTGGMTGQPVYNQAVLNVPRFGTIPNILQPRGV
jgi:hypothetical protein